MSINDEPALYLDLGQIPECLLSPQRGEADGETPEEAQRRLLAEAIADLAAVTRCA